MIEKWDASAFFGGQQSVGCLKGKIRLTVEKMEIVVGVDFVWSSGESG